MNSCRKIIIMNQVSSCMLLYNHGYLLRIKRQTTGAQSTMHHANRLRDGLQRELYHQEANNDLCYISGQTNSSLKSIHINIFLSGQPITYFFCDPEIAKIYFLFPMKKKMHFWEAIFTTLRSRKTSIWYLGKI